VGGGWGDGNAWHDLPAPACNEMSLPGGAKETREGLRRKTRETGGWGGVWLSWDGAELSGTRSREGTGQRAEEEAAFQDEETTKPTLINKHS
jgi:hypothetical protein